MLQKLLQILSAAWIAGACSLSALRAADTTAVPAVGGAFQKAQLQHGDVAPDFSVTGPKGETIKLSDFKGKIVLVDLSPTWCGPCQTAMPNNDRIFRKYADQGVVFLCIVTDDSREYYDSWIKRNAGKYKFLVTFDPAGRSGWKQSVFNTKYFVTDFPTVFVIDRDGKISETVNFREAGDDYRLDAALAKAGIKVDPALLAQAAEDQKKRDAMR